MSIENYKLDALSSDTYTFKRRSSGTVEDHVKIVRICNTGLWTVLDLERIVEGIAGCQLNMFALIVSPYWVADSKLNRKRGLKFLLRSEFDMCLTEEIYSGTFTQGKKIAFYKVVKFSFELEKELICSMSKFENGIFIYSSSPINSELFGELDFLNLVDSIKEETIRINFISALKIFSNRVSLIGLPSHWPEGGGIYIDVFDQGVRVLDQGN